MASCKFCEKETTTNWYDYYCQKCSFLKRSINLFGIDKISSILKNVLIVPEEKHSEKINTEIAKEIFSKEISLKKKRKEKKEEKSQINSDEIKEI